MNSFHYISKRYWEGRCIYQPSQHFLLPPLQLTVLAVFSSRQKLLTPNSQLLTPNSQLPTPNS